MGQTADKELDIDIEVRIPVSYDILIAGLRGESYDDLLDFIRHLDEAVGDWTFTEMLRDTILEVLKRKDDE